MEVNGAISAALVPKIRAALDAVEPDRFPAGAIVLLTAMMAAPSDQTRYLDRAELPALGLAGIDPAYRETRVPAAAAYYRISEDEYVRRTLALPEICLATRSPAQEFARCYRRALQTGG